MQSSLQQLRSLDKMHERVRITMSGLTCPAASLSNSHHTLLPQFSTMSMTTSQMGVPYHSCITGEFMGMQVYKPATAENRRAEVMFLRNYSRGVLKRETVLRVAENDLRAHELKKSSKMRKAEKVAAVQVLSHR